MSLLFILPRIKPTYPLILFTFLVFNSAFCNKTFQQAKAEIDKVVRDKTDVTTDLFNYIDKNTANQFQSREIFRRIYKYSATIAEKEKGEKFAELFALIGKRLYNNSYFDDGFYYLYKTNQYLKDNPSKDIIFMSEFRQSFGLAYFYYKRYAEAKEQFQQVLNAKHLKTNTQIGIINTYALILREQKQMDSAKYYFELGLKLAQKSNDQPWLGVLSGNLGHLYFLDKNFDKAYEFCERDYKISMDYDQYGSAINAMELLIRMDLAQNNLASAQKRLDFLDKFVPTLEYNIFNYKVLYNAKTEVAQAKGDYKTAFNCYKLVKLYTDSIDERSDQENLKKTEFQIDFEQKQAELTLLRTKKKLNEIVIYGLVGITVLIIAVFIWLLRLNIRKRKREKELSELKQEKVQRELNDTETQLRNMLTNLMEKNSLIEELTAELEEANQSEGNTYSEERVKMLERLQSFTLLTDDDWLEFKNLFEKLNPNFFTKVLTHSPDLTNAELRLITLIKLNLSNLEMSRILGISPDSVRKTSLRLRKKWGMDHPEDLVKFILSL